jgi:hypothetical protein
MKKNNHYIPMFLEQLIAWLRIGEITLYRNQLWEINEEQKIPLSDKSVLTKLKDLLPRFENIRNIVVIKIEKPEFDNVNAISTHITYDDVMAIYTLDAKLAQTYVQSLLPSMKIEQQSILDDKLSKELINWSEKRNARLGAEKLRSLPNIRNDKVIIEDISYEDILVAFSPHENKNELQGKIRFLHELSLFNRNSIKCKDHPDGLAFINDISDILQEAIDKETLQKLNLDYRSTLASLRKSHKDSQLTELIKEIKENRKIIQGLLNHYGSDYFTPALIFLKLKKMHNTINAKQFYDFINELNKINCDKELILTGIAWHSACFGYIEIHELYYESKEYTPTTTDQVIQAESSKNSIKNQPPQSEGTKSKRQSSNVSDRLDSGMKKAKTKNLKPGNAQTQLL